MRKTAVLSGFVLLGLASAPSWSEALEEINVTGLRVSGDEYSQMPAVVLQRRADFLVQSIRLTNDTRAEDARTKELYQTIRDMVADAANGKGLALSYGDEFLIPITAKDYEVPLNAARSSNRVDTSSTTIYVKVALGEKDDITRALATLNEFIKKARVSGRTEIEPEGDVGLSLVKPEKYRYEIISKIAQDAQKLQGYILGCKVELSGLANRVHWQRSDLSEPTLYVPYQVQLTGCQ